MDPSIRKGIRRRSDWIRRNPWGGRNYIRVLTKADRAKVDALFLANRKLKPNEVTNLVEQLTEKQLARKRVAGLRRRALLNMRDSLSTRPLYKEPTVVANNKKMSSRDLKIAAAASVDELLELASEQGLSNPFWYH